MEYKKIINIQLSKNMIYVVYECQESNNLATQQFCYKCLPKPQQEYFLTILDSNFARDYLFDYKKNWFVVITEK